MKYSPFLIALSVAFHSSSVRGQELNWTSAFQSDFPPYHWIQSIKTGQLSDRYSLIQRSNAKLPLLIIPVEVNFYGKGNENNQALWEFAALACGYMDNEVMSIGAWGRECKIASVIRFPKNGKLIATIPNGRDARGFYPEGSYLYKPSRLGKDVFAFVLSNGASREIEVRYELTIVRFTPEP